MTGLIFDIQRFAVHDGPGIRSTVFLKGCSARCQWCHNPESFSMRPEMQYYKERCVGCGNCVKLCPSEAHSISVEGRHSFDRRRCNACDICPGECFHNALVISGREESVEEVLRQVMDDKPYYDESGGGVTLSGGEPVLQDDFCEALLKELKNKGIHTNLQTAGFYPFDKLERLLPYLDLVMYDIKGFSKEIYNQHIHSSPSLAMENLRRLDEKGIAIIVRSPCVKGVNDSVGEIEAVAKMLSTLKHLNYYSLIPYHRLAKIKYDVLGLEFKSYEAPSKDHLEMLTRLAARYVNVRNES